MLATIPLSAAKNTLQSGVLLFVLFKFEVVLVRPIWRHPSGRRRILGTNAPLPAMLTLKTGSRLNGHSWCHYRYSAAQLSRHRVVQSSWTQWKPTGLHRAVKNMSRCYTFSLVESCWRLIWTLLELLKYCALLLKKKHVKHFKFDIYIRKLWKVNTYSKGFKLSAGYLACKHGGLLVELCSRIRVQILNEAIVSLTYRKHVGSKLIGNWKKNKTKITQLRYFLLPKHYEGIKSIKRKIKSKHFLIYLTGPSALTL